MLAIAGLIAFTFYACSRSGIDTQKSAYTPMDFKKVDLGDLHNQVVLRIYDRYDKHVNNSEGLRLTEVPRQTPVEIERERVRVVREQIISELRATPFDATLMGITNEQFYAGAIQMIDDLAANDFDIRNFTIPVCAPTVMTYVTDILDQIENLNTLSEMNTAFDEIQLRALAELRGIELDEVTGILEIARGSAYLWSNADGSFINISGARNARTMGGPKKVLVADVSASAGFFLRMGIMGAIFASTPGTNAVIFAGWALSAGISSACAALYPNQTSLPIPRPKIQLS